MPVDLTKCFIIFTFLNLLKARYNCTKFRHCPPITSKSIREKPRKSPSWIGLESVFKISFNFFFFMHFLKRLSISNWISEAYVSEFLIFHFENWFNMSQISDKTNITHSLFLSFISALNTGYQVFPIFWWLYIQYQYIVYTEGQSNI